MASDGERTATFEDDKQIPVILKTLHEQRQFSRFCDVILRVCGEQIYAHSNVLAAASPYFGSFLGQGQDLPRAFSQKTPQIIEIHIDGSEGDSGYSDAVCRVVDFMYTSSIQLTYGILTQVMEIAKIMQMDSIIEYCDRFQKGEDGNMDKVNTGDAEDKYVTTATQTELISKLEVPVSWVPNNSANAGAFSNSESSDKLIHTSRVKRKRGRPRKNEKKNEVLVQEFKDINMDNMLGDTLLENDEYDQQNIEAVEEENVESENKTEIMEEDLEDSEEESREENISNWIVERTGSGRPVRVPSKYRSSVKKSVVSSTRSDYIPKKPPGEVYTCNECPYTSDRLFHFRRHRQAHNSDSKKYNCDECDFSTSKLRALNSHKKEHLHAANKCSYCDFKAENEEILQEHLSKHSGPNPFFCSVCDMKFKSKNQLKIHLPKHSEDKPYVCDVCGNGFKWKHALKNHMITHSDRKDHLCDICGFSTAHKSQLKAHRLIHSGETFKCNVFGCHFQATKRQNLKYHMLTHTHEKPHQCEICGQSFSLSKNMKRHMLLHSNTRRFQCNHCKFSTTRYDKLKEHLLKQHDEGELPQKRHRLSDYHGSMVPPEGHRYITAKLEDGTDIQVHVSTDLDTSKVDTSSGAQILTLQQPSTDSFPIALTIENCPDEMSLAAIQQAVQFVSHCE